MAVVVRGGPLWRRNIAIRDWLRRDQDAADRYAAMKRSAVSKGATLLAYSAG
jgi:GrpB-like predicted nucleotidyltransferase (UPF0157 family)